MSKLGETKLLYEQFVAKLKEHGLDVTELDDKIVDRLTTRMQPRIDEMKGSVQRGVDGAREAAAGSDKVKDEVQTSMDSFSNSVGWKALLQDLPPQLKQMIDLILAGAKDPALLIPKLACCGGGIPFDVDEQVTKLQSRDLPTGLSESGSQARWVKMAGEVSDTGTQLQTVLSALESAKDAVDSVKQGTQSAFESITSAFRDVDETQQNTARSLDRVVDVVKGGSAGVKARSAGGSSAGAMATLESLVGEVKSAKATGLEASRSLEKLTAARSTWQSIWTSLKDLLEKLSAIDWPKLVQTMKRSGEQMPQVIQTGREIMYPKFPINMVFQPSPYAAKVESTVEQTRQICDLEQSADKVKQSADKILSIFGKSTDTATVGDREISEQSEVVKMRGNIDAVENSANEVVAKLGGSEYWETLEDDCSGAVKEVLKEETALKAQVFASKVAATTATAVASAIGVNTAQATAMAQSLIGSDTSSTVQKVTAMDAGNVTSAAQNFIGSFF
mmetsp:Transcript_3277/g.10028  ORF Transcript_3277/g.10028 Transcript_3277/m.10028 type:complete len:504 (-) Transcript_3277:51-1562(-)|eukprot:CAMPEP_0198729134 /NCGR_PEP_ID=MMETSP1475-20131203/14896_1 /TAXON_ID= ORGANISM="Unidentified sp., Strain CCMP1999" /NCGR_SAMPLE_ID=MMETSP1475 /ASSEMBLY_ACC=CAM_ASM_001111 /LENGTH=503 /DNA_ID=CAMNT_0044491703 /DNA_START=54 /DNA_END=1565 /DNA_ORIENTATION=-